MKMDGWVDSLKLINKNFLQTHLVKAKSVLCEKMPDSDGAASLLGRTEGAGEEKSFGLSYCPITHVHVYPLYVLYSGSSSVC